MKIETFDREDHQIQITAEIETEAMEQFKLKAARKISSQAKIAGFRPGKAPYEVVRRTYGDKAIQEEALTIMLDEIYPEVIKEAGIEPYGPGQLEEIVQADPPKFSFIVPLAPKVELGDYKAIRKEHVLPVITDEKVDEVLHRLQRRSAISKTAEHSAAEGDLVYLTVTGKLANPAEGEEADLIPEASRQMIAGDPRDFTDEEGNEWPFDGFSMMLVGVSAGEEKVFEHTFSDDGANDDLNGKTAIFTVKVESVHELELPTLDDEFALSIDANYETMEKLRSNILESMQSDETNRYNNRYIESLIEMLMADAQVKFPPPALETETEHVIQIFEERLQRDQMDLETYLKTRNMTREEFAAKEASQVAERNLKRNLVLEEFAIREQIQISNEEMKMVMNMAENQAKQDPSLKSLARGGVSKKQVADNLARSTINEIFTQRMMNRLRDIAAGKADAPVEEATAEIDVEPQPEDALETSEPVEATETVETTEAVSEESPKAEE